VGSHKNYEGYSQATLPDKSSNIACHGAKLPDWGAGGRQFKGLLLPGAGAAMSDFRTRLAKAAKEIGGQAELARRSGVSLRSIGNYVRGKTKPEDYVVAKLAECADVRYEWLLKDDGPMRTAAPLAQEQRAEYQAINLDRLTLVIGAVEMLLPGWSPSERASLMVLAYDHMTGKNSNAREELAAYLRRWAKSALAQPAVPDFHSPEVSGKK